MSRVNDGVGGVGVGVSCSYHHYTILGLGFDIWVWLYACSTLASVSSIFLTPCVSKIVSSCLLTRESSLQTAPLNRNTINK